MQTTLNECKTPFVRYALERLYQKKLPDDTEAEVINLAEELQDEQNKYNITDKISFTPEALQKIKEGLQQNADQRASGVYEKPAYEPGRKIQRPVLVDAGFPPEQTMSLRAGAPLPSTKEDFHSSFISEDEPIDFNHLTEMKNAYLDMLSEKRALNPYARIKNQWNERLAVIEQSDASEQEKAIQRQQLATDKDNYFASQRQKQTALVKQYYAEGHTEALTAIVNIGYPPRDLGTAIASLNQYLGQKARAGGQLTDAEREAFPDAAAYEWMEQEGDKMRSMDYQEERFRTELAKHNLLPQAGETLQLRFDRNYHFSVSGIEEDKAKQIEELLNKDKQLCSTLIHRLIYPYDDVDDWEIEEYPSQPSTKMDDYIKKLQAYNNLIESQVDLLKQHPIDLQNIRFVEEKNGIGVYEGRNKAIDGYLKTHPLFIAALDTIRRECAGQKLYFPQSEQPQLKFDGSHFDLNF